MNKIKKSAAEAIINGQELPLDWQCKSGEDCLSYDGIDLRMASLRFKGTPEEVDDLTKPIHEEVDKEEVTVVTEEATYDEEGNELTPEVTEIQLQCPSDSTEMDGVCKVLLGYEQKLAGEMELFNDPDKAHIVDSKEQERSLQKEEQDLLQYLKETDYYVIREAEEGKPYDASIKTERQSARTRISEIRALLKQ